MLRRVFDSHLSIWKKKCKKDTLTQRALIFSRKKRSVLPQNQWTLFKNLTVIHKCFIGSDFDFLIEHSHIAGNPRQLDGQY